MKARALVQIAVVAIVLIVLFSIRLDTAQAKTKEYMPFRAVEKRTTLVDPLTMTTAGLSIGPANGGTDLFSSHPPAQVTLAEPPFGPDWVMLLTVVVIVLSASAGLAGSRLTRRVHSGASSR